MFQERRSLFLPAVLAALITIAAVALSWGVVSVVVGAQEGSDQPTLIPATDSVTFDAEFQSPEVTTRWANTSLGTTVGDHVLEIDAPTGVQARSWTGGPDKLNGAEWQYSTDTCVYGGISDGVVDETEACFKPGGIAGASTTDGDYDLFMKDSLLGLGLDVPAMGASTESSIVTEAQCYMDDDGVPRAVATPPAGIVKYGGSSTLGIISNATEVDLSNVENGATYSHTISLGTLLWGQGTVFVEVKPSWGVSLDERSAYSQVDLGFRMEGRGLGGLLGLISHDSGWHTVTFRSECGFTMGSEQPMRLMQALPQLEMAPPILEDPPVTSAIGSPQSSGFTTEDSLSWQGGEYHLLATRELDALDRLTLESVLAEIATSGGVEGTNWKLFDAPTAGEPVPVVEVVLVDGAIAQIRPVVDGVASPLPDVIPTTSATPTPAATPTPTTTVAPPEEEPGGDGDG